MLIIHVYYAKLCITNDTLSPVRCYLLIDPAIKRFRCL